MKQYAVRQSNSVWIWASSFGHKVKCLYSCCCFAFCTANVLKKYWCCFSWFLVQLMTVRIKVFLQVIKRKKKGWWVLLNLINQAYVGVGVELKRTEPGPVQNAAHLCFRLQALSRSALTLGARLARRSSFPRLPGCKQSTMNSFKNVGRNNNVTLSSFFSAQAEHLKGAWP